MAKDFDIATTDSILLIAILNMQNLDLKLQAPSMSPETSQILGNFCGY
jgi:hypothetical protein